MVTRMQPGLRSLPPWNSRFEVSALASRLAWVETDIGETEHRLTYLQALITELHAGGLDATEAELSMAETECLRSQMERRDAIIGLIER